MSCWRRNSKPPLKSRTRMPSEYVPGSVCYRRCIRSPEINDSERCGMGLSSASGKRFTTILLTRELVFIAACTMLLVMFSGDACNCRKERGRLTLGDLGCYRVAN